MGRYNILFTKEKLIQSNCPLMLEKYALTKDDATGKVLAQLKLRNISEDTIIAAYFDIDGYDIEHNKVEELKECQYLDLNVAKGQQFGARNAIHFENKNVREVEIVCTKVFFRNEDKWENEDKEAKFHDVFKSKRLSDILCPEALEYLQIVEQKKYMNLNYLKCAPVEYEGIRQCVCGAYLLNDVDTCYKCKKSKQWNEINLNESDLLEKGKQYKEELEQKKEKELEEQKKRDEEAKIRKKKNRKRLKKFVAVGSVVLVIFFAIIFALEKDAINYSMGKRNYDNKQYEKSIERFEKANYYKNSEDMINSAMYKYIKSKDKEPKLTLKYAKKLSELNYKDSVELYADMQEKREAKVYFNNSEEGTEEESTVNIEKGGKLYCHVLISSESESAFNITYTAQWNGEKDEGKKYDLSDRARNKSNLYVSWDKFDKKDSEITVKVYNEATGEMIGSAKCNLNIEE